MLNSGPEPNAAEVLERGERLPSLDGLRGMAVLMVMVFHFMNDPSLAQGTAKPLFILAHIGQTGVDLFFVLSGFLITGILVDTKGREHYFRNFYARRTLRIFPLYFSVLFVLYVLLPALGVKSWWPEWRLGASHQAWQWCYMTNIAMFLGIPQIAGHFWTLAVEEHFYLLWPLIVSHFCPRVLSNICIVLILVALLSRSFLAWYDLDTFYLTPCRMDALAIGAWIALRLRQNDRSAALLRLARRVALWSGAAVLPMYILASGSHDSFLQATKFLMIGIFYGAFLLWLVMESNSTCMVRMVAHPGLKYVGKYSYGLYVFHVFALMVLPNWIDMNKLVHWTHSPIVGICLWLILVMIVSFLPAWLSWHLIEKRCLNFKHLFTEYDDPRPSVGLPN